MQPAGQRTSVQTLPRIEKVKVLGHDKDGKTIIGYTDVPEGALITSGSQEVKDD